MGQRVIINGRVVHEQDIPRPIATPGPEYTEDGHVRSFAPLTAQERPWPPPVKSDADWVEQVSGRRFRIVDADQLRCDQGWASGMYWVDELHCNWPRFLKLWDEGVFEGAVPYANGPKRFRCLDWARAEERVAATRRTAHSMRGITRARESKAAKKAARLAKTGH